jgi:hypothetical protein
MERLSLVKAPSAGMVSISKRIPRAASYSLAACLSMATVLGSVSMFIMRSVSLGWALTDFVKKIVLAPVSVVAFRNVRRFMRPPPGYPERAG